MSNLVAGTLRVPSAEFKSVLRSSGLEFSMERTFNELSRALTLPFSDLTYSRESRVASGASHKR